MGKKYHPPPPDNNEGSLGTAHHSTPRAEHRGRGVSASKGSAVNEVILKATVIPALFPGVHEGRACPLPVVSSLYVSEKRLTGDVTCWITA